MGAVDRNVFGSQEIAYECLADLERTENFHVAIGQIVKNGSRVLELGTGTGILALMAARAGAERVDAYEVTVEMARIARKNIADNDMQSIVRVHEADVTSDSIEGGKYDVLIAEMVTVGLIEEQLVPAFNNVMRQKKLNPDCQVIPSRQMTYAQLVDTDFDFFGFRLETIQIEQTWQKSPLKNELSNKATICEVDFNHAVANGLTIDPDVSARCEFEIKKSGTVNAVRLLSESVLSGSVTSGWTQCMNSPAIIPIEEFEVSEGELVNLSIKYEMGGEMKTYQAKRL